ncbi:MAG: aspartyl/asparaginyl beta-hydroxylase domain-containing protein [Gammaproteobacteria bacterium]|nr:aspartyl/asparaginyl beta-hydroxylase domain-containing protein [Gammaproteobacteria bacterium]
MAGLQEALVKLFQNETSLQYFTKIAEHIKIGPLLEELDASPELWLADTSRQRKVRCQRNTRNIFLRAAKKPLPPGAKNANDVHEIRIMPEAKKFPCMQVFCESVAKSLGGTLGRATLVALMPGSQVFPHVDSGAYYRIRDRMHLVLKSTDGSLLGAGDETVLMHTGELWVFDNKQRHWAKNPSEELRVHLIFDVLPAQGRGFYTYLPEDPKPEKCFILRF